MIVTQLRLCGILVVFAITLVLASGYAEAATKRVYEGRLNLNTASVAELTRLPGVGETIAYRIVKARDNRGSFSDSKELLTVKGISPSRYARLKGLISLEGVNDLRVYLDVNTITAPLLSAIPGITSGEVRGILAYRKSRGTLGKLDELLRVPGIDQKRLAELKEWLVVVKK